MGLPAPNTGALLELRGIVKEFPGVRALDGVDLEVAAGEVLGLVGENGAGKSTLIKILGGIHRAGSYRGEVLLSGQPRSFRSTEDARRAGVAVVHQELSLVPELTVAENLLLGREPRRFGLVDSDRMIRETRRMLSRFGSAADIDPETPVGQLGVGLQQIVEIARALGTEARLVILDEPTAALTEREAERLFDIVRRGRTQGTSFIYISHRLEEIFQLCDRVAVLRDGRHVATRETDETDSDEIVSFMIGGALASLEVGARAAPGETVLQVEHLRAERDAAASPRVLDDVSFHVRAGEVLALAGAMGAGRTALLSTLFGTFHGRTRGRVLVGGEPVALDAPRDAIGHGIALVPEDRKGAGLVLEMSVGDNMTLASLSRHTRAGIVDGASDVRAAADEAGRLRVKAPALDAEVGTLSGGNQQKIVLGKWLLTEPRVLLLDEPTRGVDVGAKAEIYRIIGELVTEGLAVVLASSDLPEVLLLGDRILVLREGRVAGQLAREQASEDAIMQLAVGRRRGP